MQISSIAILFIIVLGLHDTSGFAAIDPSVAKKAIALVAKRLQTDKVAVSDLGKLKKVQNVLGTGEPSPGIVAVRFNASFQKAGFGCASIPLPFGLGQTNKPEENARGTMVGQVKATVSGGKVTQCSVFRDLGYGRSFDLKC